MLKKIVIIGPESTGKSTLCAQLAAHYNTIWIEEYAREYLLTNGREYTFNNLLDVARGQIEKEEAGVKNILYSRKHSLISDVDGQPNLLFIDTDMYVLKVWCEFVFNRCHHWILNRIVERKYDLYLLCDVDLPWVKDELREYPDLVTRKKLYHHYKDLIINQQVPWVNISGNYEQRLQQAIDAVSGIIS